MPYVCPWWSSWFTIGNPLRHLLHDPQKIVGSYVRPGMTVLDVGCGVGWFSIPMAQMVGERGKVIAVDLQPQMLDMLRRRAGGTANIELHRCQPNRLGIDAQVDFALAFAMLHEAPDQRRLLGEIRDCLKPDGRLLLAEPPIHVPAKAFAQESANAEAVGFQIVERPRLRWCRAVVLEKAHSISGREPMAEAVFPPKFIDEATETAPASPGSRAGNVTKDAAALACGLVAKALLFIKVGERVKCESGCRNPQLYGSRVMGGGL